MNGMSKEFEKKLFTMNYPITIYPLIENSLNEKVLNGLKDEFKDFKFSPFIKTQAVLRNGDKISGIVMYGVQFDDELKMNYILKKRVENQKIDDFQLVVGSGIKKSLNIFNDNKVVAIFTNTSPVGLSLSPKMKRFEVVNSFKSGLVSYDKVFAYTTISSLQKILNKSNGYYSGIHVLSDNPMQDIKKLENYLSKDVGTVGWWEQNGNLFYAMEIEKMALFIVLMLIILVASLNTISSILMTVMNRRKDIALLLCLGASKGEIKRIFFYLGSIIGIGGMGFGILLGLLSVYILGNFDIINIPEDVYGTSHLPVDLSIVDFLSIIVGAVVIIIVSSVYPAYKASNVDIINVLRHE
jgi:putative ABC transport system permease protein